MAMIFARLISIFWLVSCFWFSYGRAQNVDRLCRQVYNDCQACSVFQTECANNQAQRPNGGKPQRPEYPSTLAPVVSTTPAVLPPRPPNCFELDHGCNTSEECCNGNCKVVSFPMNGHTYTMKACKAA